jgi:riboflavin biosynthesis pyrimidine reductase
MRWPRQQVRKVLSPRTPRSSGAPTRWRECAGSSEDAYRWIMATLQPEAMLEGSGSLVPRGQGFSPLHTPALPEEELRQDYLPESVVGIPGRKWLVVTDSKGLVRWMYKEFPGDEWQGWHILVLVTASTPVSYLGYLRQENITYQVCGQGQVDLPLAMKKLVALGIRKLVSTAGGKLSGALLRANLIDEVCIEYFPALIGGSQTPCLFQSADMLPDESPLRLHLENIETLPNQHIRLFLKVSYEG